MTTEQQDLSDEELRHLDPLSLTTPAAARDAMVRLDDIIAGITEQVSEAKRNAASGAGYADTSWFNKAERALRGAKTSRNAAQMRLGELNRVERAVAHKEQPTLRDYFAAKAMAVFCHAAEGFVDDAQRAECAYKMADAMLAERSKS